MTQFQKGITEKILENGNRKKGTIYGVHFFVADEWVRKTKTRFSRSVSVFRVCQKRFST